MVKIRTGVSSLLSSPSSPTIPNTIFAARVEAIILNNKDYPKVFKKYGEWSNIGSIFFSKLNMPNSSTNFSDSQLAKPLFPNDKNYPLENEVVYIMSLPTAGVQQDVNQKQFYYFQPVNLWNSTHHNAIPDPIYADNLPPSQQQDYEQTEGGTVRRVTDGGTEIKLGSTFNEKLIIKNLQPYEGDVIKESRWGQSIRFGSTVKDSSPPNPWSRIGENGDPITIIRNGQHNDGTDPWIPQVEDINQDPSNIYLTTTQAIPIEVNSANKKYESYSSKPTSPDKYDKEQVLLNSGRLFFQAKTESILLSAGDSINLSSINSVNIDSPKTVIQSKEVYLGDKNATEPIILGNKFLTDLQKLLTQIISLSVALQVPIGTPIPFVPHAGLPVPAVNVQQAATTMLQRIQSYKSKVSKTK